MIAIGKITSPKYLKSNLMLAHWRRGVRDSLARSRSHIDDPLQRVEHPLARDIARGATGIVSVHWLVHCANPQFIRRQDLERLEPSPFVPPQLACDIFVSGERRIFTTSYCWHEPTCPDRTGARLRSIISFLRWFVEDQGISEAEQHRYGLFIDFMCLWQKPRTAEQDAQFWESLSSMGWLYCSIHGSTVLQFSDVLPRPANLDSQLPWNDTPYFERAWTVYEDATARLADGIYNTVPGLKESKQHRLGKLYNLSQQLGPKRGYQPVEMRAPEPFEDVVRRITTATVTYSPDKEAVISAFMEIARKICDATDPLRTHLQSGFVASARGLREAARFGAPTSEIERMLADGVVADEPDDSGMSALMEASLQGHAQAVDVLLSRGGILLERVNVEPLGIDDQALGQLLEKFDRLPGRWGCTALIMASSHGHVSTVRRLIEAGASWYTAKYDELNAKGRQTLLAALATCDETHVIAGLARAALEASSTAALLRATIVRTAHVLAQAKADKASRPTVAEAHVMLANRLQLAISALIQEKCLLYSVASGVDDDGRPVVTESMEVDRVLRTDDGVEAMALAVSIEAKIFLSQPVVQEHVQRLWLGEVLHAATSSLLHDRRTASSTATLLLLLAVQTPLLPVVAAWPPLEHALASSESIGRLYLLDAPIVKFYLCMTSDVVLVLLYTLTPTATMLADSALTVLLHVWIVAALLREAGEMRKVGFVSYRSEQFNWLDLSGLLFALAGLLHARASGSETSAQLLELHNGVGPVLRSLACLLLWLRVGRVLLASSTFGPFVLMVFRMLTDLLRFLILEALLLLAYTSATYKLFERSEQHSPAVLAAELEAAWDGEESCDAEFSEFGRTLTLLWEGTLSNQGYFRCVQQSSHPEALVLMYTYVILTVVLMMNLLIAMMGKSFDVIWESAAATYLAGFAQMTLTYASSPPAPLPFNALSFPYQAWTSLRGVAHGAADSGWTKLPDAHVPADGDSASASAAKHSSEAEAHQRLREKMLAYVTEHEDDVAEEERWRTKMHKAFSERAHRVDVRLDEQHQTLDRVHARLDEQHQLLRATLDQGHTPTSSAHASRAPHGAPGLEA